MIWGLAFEVAFSVAHLGVHPIGGLRYDSSVVSMVATMARKAIRLLQQGRISCYSECGCLSAFEARVGFKVNHHIVSLVNGGLPRLQFDMIDLGSWNCIETQLAISAQIHIQNV